MSCLMLSELSLSEQIAVELAFGASLERKFNELFNPLDPPATKPFIPLAAPASPGAGGSNPFPLVESAA